MRIRRLVVAGVVVAFGLAACTSEAKDDGQTLPPPSSTSTTVTTTPIDLTQVSLNPLPPGKPTTTTRPPGPGKASLFGKVRDADGVPIAGALVRASYYQDPGQPEIIEALSGEDGGYRFDQLYGGPWRIRAWLAPTVATFETVSLFLAEAAQMEVNLKVKRVPDVVLTARMAPDPPLVGWPAELAVYVVTQTVDAEGRVDRQPAAGTEVSLTDAGAWRIQSGSNPAMTEEDGTFRWTLACNSEGKQTLTAVAFGREFPLALPSCLSPASTTTTTTAPPSSSTSSTKPKPKATTTTSRPKSTSSTRAGVRPQ